MNLLIILAANSTLKCNGAVKSERTLPRSATVRRCWTWTCFYIRHLHFYRKIFSHINCSNFYGQDLSKVDLVWFVRIYAGHTEALQRNFYAQICCFLKYFKIYKREMTFVSISESHRHLNNLKTQSKYIFIQIFPTNI